MAARRVLESLAPPEPETPTGQAYPELQTAYDYFNAELFEATLPASLITLSRKANTRGYYGHARFESTDGVRTGELALNPDVMDRPDRDTLGTLVHEMAHVWQFTYGEPSRSGYHNKEWALKMIDIGLMPSNTGKPGGKKTGQQMTHYILDGGPFDASCAKLLDSGFAITWRSVPASEKKGIRPKYRCDGCRAQVWGKPGLNIRCEDCDLPMQLEEAL